MDFLQLYNHFSLLTLAASLLAILGLRIVTGSTSAKATLINHFRIALEPVIKKCLRARSAALDLEFDASWIHGSGNVLAFPSERSGRRFVVTVRRDRPAAG